MHKKVNLAEKLSSFSEQWSPKIVGQLNGQYVKVVKFQGEYVWHHHDDQDELFLALKGNFEIHLPDEIVTLNEGEFFIVVHALLFEPADTRNTGNVDHAYTIEPESLDRI